MAALTSRFLHTASKAHCDSLLLADGGNEQAGKFLYRGSAKADIVLSVIYKGKVTHHQVKVKKSELQINGKATGTCSLDELTTYLGEPRGKFWPLGLTEGVPSPEARESDEHAAHAAALADAQAQREREAEEAARASQAAEEEKEAEIAGDSTALKSGEFVLPEMTQYYHGKISDAEAKELLSVAKFGGGASGIFLFGDRVDGKPGFCLWTLQNGQHKLSNITLAKDNLLRIEGAATACSTLESLQKKLSVPYKARDPNDEESSDTGLAGWTCLLTSGVLGYKTKSQEQRDAELAAEKEAALAKEQNERDRDRAERKAHQDGLKVRQDELKDEVANTLKVQASIEAELMSEELQQRRSEAKNQIALQKKQKKQAARESQKMAAVVDVYNKMQSIAQSGDIVAVDSDDSDLEETTPKDKWTRKSSLKDRNKSGLLYSFVHKPMSENEAHAWLYDGIGSSGSDELAAFDGKFLVRLQSSGAKSYYLDLLVDGQARTYKVAKKKNAKEGDCFYVDDNITNAGSIELVVKYLREMHEPWWTTPLNGTGVTPITDVKLARKESKRVVKAHRASKKSKK